MKRITSGYRPLAHAMARRQVWNARQRHAGNPFLGSFLASSASNRHGGDCTAIRPCRPIIPFAATFLSEFSTSAVEESGGREKALDVLLRQNTQDLSDDEQKLKAAIESHQELRDDLETPNETYKRSLYNLRDCFETLEYWDFALKTEQELEDFVDSTLDIAACIFRQGKLFMRMEDVVRASSTYEQALDLFKMEHEGMFHADIGNVMVAMAGVHFHRGKQDDCMETLQEAEIQFRKHSLPTIESSAEKESQQQPHPDLVKCLENQGMILRMGEEFEKAQTKFVEALEIVDHDDWAKRQSFEMHIADMYSAMGNLDRSIECYETLLSEDKARRKDPNEQSALDGVLLHSIGLLHSQQGKLELAVTELTQALENKRKFGGLTNPEVAETLNALGSVYGVLETKHKALKCFQEALLIEKMHRPDKNDPQILHILRNISVLKGEKVPKWDG